MDVVTDPHRANSIRSQCDPSSLAKTIQFCGKLTTRETILCVKLVCYVSHQFNNVSNKMNQPKAFWFDMAT